MLYYCYDIVLFSYANCNMLHCRPLLMPATVICPLSSVCSVLLTTALFPLLLARTDEDIMIYARYHVSYTSSCLPHMSWWMHVRWHFRNNTDFSPEFCFRLFHWQKYQEMCSNETIPASFNIIALNGNHLMHRNIKHLQSDRSCTRGMVHNKIHLILQGFLRPSTSIALPGRIVA